MVPLIAIPGYSLREGSATPWPKSRAVAVPLNYINAIHRAGGREAILSPDYVDAAQATELLERFDGLMLIGGGDVNPDLYGQERRPETDGISPRRDQFEIALTLAAIDVGLPLLAICRGIQVLNVALGGELTQHLGAGIHGEVTIPDHVLHTVNAVQGSSISELVKANNFECSSHHHQAIRTLGDGLVVTASAPDGVIEGVESSMGWVVGVQWHPEVTAEFDQFQQNLFDGFVQAASESSNQNRRAEATR